MLTWVVGVGGLIVGLLGAGAAFLPWLSGRQKEAREAAREALEDAVDAATEPLEVKINGLQDQVRDLKADIRELRGHGGQRQA